MGEVRGTVLNERFSQTLTTAEKGKRSIARTDESIEMQMDGSFQQPHTCLDVHARAEGWDRRACV